MNNPAENPFASPQTPQSFQVHKEQLCPECESQELERPTFTNWGGYIGPWVLRHTICKTCGHEFNAATRRSNYYNIIFYQAFSIVAFLIGIFGFFWLISFLLG